VDGVTGPDEYTALVDDNAFTNVVVRHNLRAAVELTDRFPDVAARLAVTEAERAAWADAADRMVVPHDAALGVTAQDSGFTRRARWDFDAEGRARYPLADHAHFAELYRHQVVKQADVVMAHHLVPDEASLEQKRRDFDYYEPMTVRDSSLSAPAQAVVAAEVGYGDLAWAYTRETALLDLVDRDGSTQDGLHLAALAGAWTALVEGFGGLRHGGEGLRLAPRLPPRLERLTFRVSRGPALVEVDVRPGSVTYTLLAGERVRLVHHGDPFELTGAGPSAERAVPPWPELDAPGQPPGRTPTA
jgi:alpha,alpha-trehalose phosphorylase/kojibiose phosphorylase